MARLLAVVRCVGQFFSCQFVQLRRLARFRFVEWPVRVGEGMSKPEQVGITHESLSDLLHAIDRRTLIRIIAAAAGIAVGELVEVDSRDPRIQIPGLSKPGTSKFVDGVYTVHTADGRVVGFWMFEVELSLDLKKRRKWSLYVIAFEYELNAAGQLAVFSPVPALRKKIRTRVIPRMRVRPILIEPDQIERITDYDEARRRPELTILGCLFHTHEPTPLDERLAVFRAAWIAIQSLDEKVALRYGTMVMSLVPEEVMTEGINQLREAGELDESRWEVFTDSERYGSSFHRGREEGREEGREVLRRLLVATFEQRGFVLTPAQRERIESCESFEILERWLTTVHSAAVNQHVDEILS
jgi:hypothetical protein